MQAAEVTPGRTFAVRFDHGEDFYTSLTDFCRTHNIRQGFIPMFIAGFRDIELVGTCERLENPEAPVWSSVHFEYVEALSAGTLAYDDTTKGLRPHVHISAGLKSRSAAGYTSHLLGATVQFLTEMYVVEIVNPRWERSRDPASDRRISRTRPQPRPGVDAAAHQLGQPRRARCARRGCHAWAGR